MTDGDEMGCLVPTPGYWQLKRYPLGLHEHVQTVLEAVVEYPERMEAFSGSQHPHSTDRLLVRGTLSRALYGWVDAHVENAGCARGSYDVARVTGGCGGPDRIVIHQYPSIGRQARGQGTEALETYLAVRATLGSCRKLPSGQIMFLAGGYGV